MSFETSRQIHDELYAALGSILKESQRKAVEDILRAHLGGGGISKDEIRGSIRRELRTLRTEHVLSGLELDRIMAFLEKEE